MCPNVVVVGISGCGREVLDVLEASNQLRPDWTVRGVVDDSPSQQNLERLADRGYEYLGSIDQWLSEDPDDKFVVGIGMPSIRRTISSRLERNGLTGITIVHPSSTLGTGIKILPGTVICAGVIVSTNVRLGRYVHLNAGSIIGHDAQLDDFVSVNPGAVVSGEVVVRNEVLIGASSTILQGRTLGANSVVGAGALVTKDVPPSSLVKGVPGRW